MLAIVPPRLADLDALILFRDRGKVQMFPSAIVEQNAGEIVDVQSLHHEDDGALATDCRSATSVWCCTQSAHLVRAVSEYASSAFSGSSMMMMSPPRPVS